MIDFGTGVYLRSPKLSDLNRIFRNGKYINAHRYSLIRSWEDEC